MDTLSGLIHAASVITPVFAIIVALIAGVILYAVYKNDEVRATLWHKDSGFTIEARSKRRPLEK